MADARSDILSRLRAQRHEAAPVPPVPVLPQPNDIVSLFVERAEAGRATVERLASRAALGEAVRRYLEANGLPHRVVCGLGDDAALAGIDCIEFEDCDWAGDGAVVLNGCAAGVAETGTLVITSGPDHDARTNYLAETLLVVLPARDIVATYEDIWPGILRDRDGAPRLVSFITGPSRTADIEQTIELGAHGPRRLHLLIVSESP